MELNKLKSIKLSLMKSLGEMNKKQKTNYSVKTSANITINNLVKKTIEEHGIENVLTSIYKDIMKENTAVVDSIGMWVNYDGKTYENSILIETLNDMEKFSDEKIYPIFELFKLMSPAEGLIED